MKNFVVKTACGEVIGTGKTILDAVKSALTCCEADDFVEWCCYAEEQSEWIEQFSMFELYDMAIAG